jgi:hypothetical protein
MIQGWHAEEYLFVFEASEIDALTERYGIAAYLPGYKILGLKSWDDFIVRDEEMRTFTLPTIPMDAQYLQPFELDVDSSAVLPDPRFVDKIKWYIKPIIFGGDPSANENMAWLSLDQHVEAVKYWNRLYRDVKQRK